jgi:hypothetical protein
VTAWVFVVLGLFSCVTFGAAIYFIHRRFHADSSDPRIEMAERDRGNYVGLKSNVHDAVTVNTDSMSVQNEDNPLLPDSLRRSNAAASSRDSSHQCAENILVFIYILLVVI